MTDGICTIFIRMSRYLTLAINCLLFIAFFADFDLAHKRKILSTEMDLWRRLVREKKKKF